MKESYAANRGRSWAPIHYVAISVSLLLAAAPFAPSAAADERLGVATHYAHGWDPGSIPGIARAGIGGVRDELYWREIERERGVYSFPEYFDRYMGVLAQNNVAPLIVLSFENELYDGGLTPHSDEGIDAYARYGVEVLRRYGRQIKAVEVWNEFNGGFARGPATEDRAGSYLRLLGTAYAELKRERPDMVVVGGATAGVPLPYWEKLLAGGALASMDVLSVHPYRYDFPPEGIETDIAELAALVAKYNGGRPKPIWVTEIGWSARLSTGPGDLAIDDHVQAQFLVRAYALLLSANVQRIYWYLLRDYEDFNMGLLRNDAAFTPKPAQVAMTTMIQQLRGARFVERERTLADLYSLRFRQPSGQDIRVMWSLRPRTISVSGATGSVDIFGRTEGPSDTLALGDSPLFVTGAVRGLPAATETTIATARLGFSGAQGRHGWSYGHVGASATFTPLPTFSANDWRTAWSGSPPWLSITATDQHPSAGDGVPVAAVRRWQSDRKGTVRIAGSFFGGKYGGDGVGVGIVIDGKSRLNRIIGGGAGKPVAEAFDLVEAVNVGTTVDFFVNPGPSTNIEHDGTAVTVTISRSER